MDKFKNYINGKCVDAVSGKTFKNINPANHEDIIGEFAYSEKADVDNAVAAAKEAYKKWRL
ncbi:MAG TPA: aldehyde dehydrogenase family protein, partial [Candidatus Kapabacteria bacterium]|nr:aldehyde dehydrogenase family protein [Candidatus Kapabacteria bacterium]